MKNYYSKQGYVFAKKDKSEVYETVIYLGCNDSLDNYIEITLEEATRIIKEREELLYDRY